MSDETEHFTTCDFCHGAIPDGADRIQGVAATLIVGGAATPFSNLDFCCTEHMGAFVASQAMIPTPVPPYPPPPQA